MKKLSLVTLFIAALLAFKAEAAFNYFGSIAYSPATGRYGWSAAASYWNADQIARANCGAWDCRIVAQVQNGCAGLAVGYRGYGTGYGVNSSYAVGYAVRSCNNYTAGCRGYAWVCTAGFH